MTISIHIPPEHEKVLREALGPDLDRAALEALAIEGYRVGKLSSAEVGRLIGIQDRWKVGEWLASHGVALNYSRQDLEDDRRRLDELFGKTG